MEALTRGELIVALALGVAFFAFAYFASPRKTVPLLICLIPFQAVDTLYGTINVLFVYAVTVAFALKNRINYLPLIGVVLLIVAAYVISTGFAHPATRFDHVLYVFNFFSAILLFYIVYNFVRGEADIGLVIRTLVTLNILVLAYCTVQLFFGRTEFFGIDELAIVRNRGEFGDGEARLRGPFAAVGITAEYLVLSILMFAYLLAFATRQRQRIAWYVLVGLNFLFLVATANRGGFLVLVGSAGLFLIMFRSQLGLRRTMSIAVSGVLLLAVSSIVLINFTDFDLLFNRLEATSIEAGVPDTRALVWAEVVPRIEERLLFGHGPRLDLLADAPYRGYRAVPYPHNLYLFIAYTIGAIGIFVYLLFFVALFRRLSAAAKLETNDKFTQGFVKLGILLLIAFLIDQLKVEALRMSLIDYWHYLFALFAICLALADDLLAKAKQAQNLSKVEPLGSASGDLRSAWQSNRGALSKS